ncbi:glycine cleavage system protein H [Pseudomonas laurylsulfatiphila]
MNFTGVRLFSKNHLWVQDEETTFDQIVGITRHALDQLGDIKLLYVSDDVELSKLVRQGRLAFTIESVKSVIDYESPISGSVVEVNGAVINSPEEINKDPENNGWILKIKPESRAQTSTLMSSAQYVEYLKTC